MYSRMKLKSNCKLREIAGEKMIVMHGEQGLDLTRVVQLNGTAELLWNELHGKEFTREHTAQLLTTTYGIEQERAIADAGSWIDAMQKAGLISI